MLAGRTAVLPQRGAVSMPALPSSRALPAALTGQTLCTDVVANSLRRAELVIQVRVPYSTSWSQPSSCRRSSGSPSASIGDSLMC